MPAYVRKRLLLLPLSFLSISFVLFLLTRLLPGGPLERALTLDIQARQATPQMQLTQLDAQQLATLKAYYGLDRDLLSAYGHWLLSFCRGDLGSSLRYQEPVAQLIAERMPVSLLFGIWSLFLAYGCCVPLALALTYFREHRGLRFLQLLLIAASAVPSYVYASLFFLYAASSNALFPLDGLTSPDFAQKSWGEKCLDIAWHAVLPLAAYGLGQLASLSTLLHHQLEDNLGHECVRLALAKGATRWRALWDHAWPLSYRPLIATLPQQLAWIFAGAMLIERIFNIDGMGLFAYEALIERDYPIVLGFLALLSLLHLSGQLAADLLLAALDPRVRWETGA